MIIWIVLIFYKTGLVEDLDEIGPAYLSKDLDLLHPGSLPNIGDRAKLGENLNDSSQMLTDGAAWSKTPKEEQNRSPLGLSAVYQDHTEQWRSLSPNHWLTLLSYYNISISGR